ncbi:MAG: TRAP transporter small permease [Spirochaetes bacterium]|nr:TRAP transporter small permease [Spirochaetota bacterium]
MLGKIASIMAQITAKLEVVVRFVSIILLAVLIGAVFFQVARRTVIGKSFVELEEFSIVLAAWVASFTISYTVRKKTHVMIEVFSSKLPPLGRRVLDIVVNLIILVALVWITIDGWSFTLRKMLVPLTVLPIKSGWWYMSFPIGMAFACIFLLDNVLQAIITPLNNLSAETPQP